MPTGFPFPILFHGNRSGRMDWVHQHGRKWLAHRDHDVPRRDRRRPTNSGFPAPYTNFVATSDGGLELCLGEVDDVLNLLSAVTALPNANANQVLMWGHSLGSCVTERAVERGATVQVAVSLDGPTDFTAWTDNNPVLAPTVADQDARSSAWCGE